MKDKKNILIGALLFAVVAMSIGYAALQQTLTINGTAAIATWDVEITAIAGTPTGTALDRVAPSFTSSTATFDTILQAKGDSMSYAITIQNKGTIDAKLNNITFSPASGYDSSPIIYDVTGAPAANSVLAAGATTTCTITVTFDSTLTDEQIAALTNDQKTKSLTATLEYVQNTSGS